MYDSFMLKTTAVTGVAFLSMLSGGCADSRSPVAPSALTSWPQLSGSYTLTLTPCEVPMANSIASTPTSPYQSIWTFTQEDDVVTGRYRNDSPPAVSSGSLTARVDKSGDIVVTNLQFSWSSSHVGGLRFSGSGDGQADKIHISGTLSGEQSFTPSFGGIAIPGTACSGTNMPFTFNRRS
jgi:hypothetical protein